MCRLGGSMQRKASVWSGKSRRSWRRLVGVGVGVGGAGGEVSGRKLARACGMGWDGMGARQDGKPSSQMLPHVMSVEGGWERQQPGTLLVDVETAQRPYGTLPAVTWRPHIDSDLLVISYARPPARPPPIALCSIPTRPQLLLSQTPSNLCCVSSFESRAITLKAFDDAARERYIIEERQQEEEEEDEEMPRHLRITFLRLNTLLLPSEINADTYTSISLPASTSTMTEKHPWAVAKEHILFYHMRDARLCFLGRAGLLHVLPECFML
ncbi:uncharacterized protein MYCFIDRAFT_208804 [Pseudocercospora fijiensis CIRAD86]|uniref:Uncharacterized protein n=1 Tax=Pseudocercospora fijiensis (strain CIRAD86) TaxID=383855 RepID=M2ZK49_PSEFD|nr:uncharacterized protein MYCFIDRAFT_208804 [Pseudocercospora fijiensis CIRAD86]EME79479.1 hypothetical protein MYCFIDRAFT_208804 [Pseudocercospora fijiensis CIRAD86]